MSHELAALPVLATTQSLEEDRNSSLDEKKTFDGEKDLEGTAAVEAAPAYDEIYDIKSGDPLPDVSGDLPVETSALSIRAIVVGCGLGSVVQASNLYLGLKTGFTFGPQLFGAIFGFAVLKSVSKLPNWAGGGYFGEKENCTVQTAATAAGGLGILFVSGIPAMYQLNLLGESPSADMGRLLAFTACCAFYGMVFAIPLRSWYVLKQKLVFPTPTATALTIRSLHAGAGGALIAKKKSIMLGASFVGAIILRVVSQYAPGIMWDWHPAWWLATWGATNALTIDNYGFYWENTPAFLGAGILTGVNASLSLYFGGIFFWGIMAPMLMKTGTTVARDFTADYNGYPVFNYTKMTFAHPKGLVSPRYWLLWGGIFLMMTCSFAEIFCNGKSIYTGFRDAAQEGINFVLVRRGGVAKYAVAPSAEDPAPEEDKIGVKIWAPMLLVICVFTVVVLSKLFGVDVGISILAIFLGFIFSFIGVQCAGDTDINPISTCAKATQLVVGGTTHGKFLDTVIVDPTTQVSVNVGAMRINLLAALISGGAAAQACDMTGDLKTGHLLRAKPKYQFVAQACGAFTSIFLSVGLFVLFSKAYPCITDANAATCPFGIPSVTSWAAVARATTSTDGLPFPASAAYFALGLSLFGLAIVIAKNTIIPERFRGYVPNMVAFGLAAVLPPSQLQYGLAMAVASVSAHYWRKYRLLNYDLYAFPLAAGLIAGEGLGGVVNAAFVIAGIDGSVYGTALGCPGNVFCG